MKHKTVVSRYTETTIKRTPSGLDCEQSLFFLNLVRAMHASGSGKAARRAKRGRNFYKPLLGGHLRRSRSRLRAVSLFHASPVSRRQSRAWPFACLAFARRTTEKRETARSLLRDLKCPPNRGL